jgi:hypothetical protein
MARHLYILYYHMTRQGLFHITLKSKEHVGILETLIDDHVTWILRPRIIET